MLIAVLMSVLLISREIESRTVFNILAKPVSRWQFLLGKYFGLMATVALNVVLMMSLLVALVALYQHEFDLRLLLAGGMTLLEMALLTAFATLFAVLTKPMLGSVLTLAVFVAGHLAEDVWLLTAHVRTGLSGPVIAALYYTLPNLERFDFKTEVVHGLAIPPAMVAWTVVYGLAYTAMVLVLAGLRFSRKDLV